MVESFMIGVNDIHNAGKWREIRSQGFYHGEHGGHGERPLSVFSVPPWYKLLGKCLKAFHHGKPQNVCEVFS